MSFLEAFDKVLPNIKNWDIPREWLSCISWSDIFQSLVSYSLDWNKISKRLLTRGMKGVHIEIVTIGSFSNIVGRLYSYQDLPAFLIWSINEDKVTLTPSEEELQSYLRYENQRLSQDLIDAQVRVIFGQEIVKKILAKCTNDKLGIIALRTLNNTAKYEVTEERLREELLKYGLPENLVYCLKNRGSKAWYHLADTPEEQKELEQRNKLYSENNNAEKKMSNILKELIPKKEGAHINCHISNLDKGLMTVSVRKPRNLTESQFSSIWNARGFTIETIYGPIYAEKRIMVPLKSPQSELRTETCKEIQVTINE